MKEKETAVGCESHPPAVFCCRFAESRKGEKPISAGRKLSDKINRLINKKKMKFPCFS